MRLFIRRTSRTLKARTAHGQNWEGIDSCQLAGCFIWPVPKYLNDVICNTIKLVVTSFVS